MDLIYLRENFDKLSKDCAEKEQKFLDSIQQASASGFIQGFPQIEDLNHGAIIFFLTAQKILTKILSLLNLLSQPQREKGYTELKRYCFERYGKDDYVFQLISHYDQFLDEIWNIRNSIEHKNGKDKNFKVENIFIDPKNSIVLPTVEYSYVSWSKNKIKTDKKYDLLKTMGFCIAQMQTYIEDAVLVVSRTFLDEFIPIQYHIEVDEKEKAPFRYSVRFEASS